MTDLFQHSIHLIQANQSASGAYLASPTFSAYRYSWFRDGAFVAYAMDLAGQHDSAHRFHDWAARVILRHADKSERAIQKAARGESVGDDYLHTRYTLDGDEGPADWPNFQLDGLGTWLWALAEHNRRPLPRSSSPIEKGTGGRGSLPSHWWQAVDLTAHYLAALWRYPCYDLWEEHPEFLHPYTLAAIYAGLKAADSMIAVSGRSSAVADEIRRFVLERGVRNGHLVKHISPQGNTAAVDSQPPTLSGVEGSAVVDASLIGVATPYRLLAPDDPLMRATVACIEADLHCPGGGVHRYRADTYYGGGEWLLLTGWLGWYYAEVGETTRVQEMQRWVEAQADAAGNLPEQASHHLLAPDRHAEWEAHWGPIAKPLLWSHAMYLILVRFRRASEGLAQ